MKAAAKGKAGGSSGRRAPLPFTPSYILAKIHSGKPPPRPKLQPYVPQTFVRHLSHIDRSMEQRLSEVSRLSDEQLSRITRRRIYITRGIQDSLPHSHVAGERLALDPSTREWQFYDSTLSRDELKGPVHMQIQSTPVLVDHQMSEEPVGVVIAGAYDRATNSYDCALRLFDTRKGRDIAAHIEVGRVQAVSMHHSRGVDEHGRDTLTLKEISLCMKGKRKDSWLLSTVDLDFDDPVTPDMARPIHPANLFSLQRHAELMDAAMPPPPISTHAMSALRPEDKAHGTAAACSFAVAY